MSTGSPIFPGPTIFLLRSVLGLGWGRWSRCGSCCSLCPPCTNSLMPLCLHRLQGSSKPRDEGPGRAGGTRGEPHPTSLPASLRLFFFHPCPPLPLFSLSLGLPLIFRAGRKHGRTSSFLSLAIRRSPCPPCSPSKPQLLPLVLPQLPGEELTRKSVLGPAELLAPRGQKPEFPCPWPDAEQSSADPWPLVLHTGRLVLGGWLAAEPGVTVSKGPSPPDGRTRALCGSQKTHNWTRNDPQLPGPGRTGVPAPNWCLDPLSPSLSPFPWPHLGPRSHRKLQPPPLSPDGKGELGGRKEQGPMSW